MTDYNSFINNIMKEVRKYPGKDYADLSNFAYRYLRKSNTIIPVSQKQSVLH